MDLPSTLPDASEYCLRVVRYEQWCSEPRMPKYFARSGTTGLFLDIWSSALVQAGVLASSFLDYPGTTAYREPDSDLVAKAWYWE